jgi:hypothetical protein
MAVQIRWQDGSHQWLRGTLYQGREPYQDARGFTRWRDGFTIATKDQRTDFASDVSVISHTEDARVTDWSVRPNQS